MRAQGSKGVVVALLLLFVTSSVYFQACKNREKDSSEGVNQLNNNNPGVGIEAMKRGTPWQPVVKQKQAFRISGMSPAGVPVVQHGMVKSWLNGTASVVQERHVAPDVEKRFQVVHEVVGPHIWVRL